MRRESRSKAQAVTKSQITWLFVSMTVLNGVITLLFSLQNGRGLAQGEINAVASAAGVLVALVVYYALGRPRWPVGAISISCISVNISLSNSNLVRTMALAVGFGLVFGLTVAVIHRVIDRASGSERARLTPGEAAIYDAEIDQASFGPGVERTS